MSRLPKDQVPLIVLGAGAGGMIAAGRAAELGVEVLVVQADLTDQASVADMMAQVQQTFGSLDLLVLNASGGMESGMGEDYALVLNRDAQLNVLDAATPLLHDGSRVVFVTSH